MVFFDYFITFDQEVELFWHGKMTGATVLFLANRYLTLAYFVYSMLVEFAIQTLPSAKVSKSLAVALFIGALASYTN